MRLVIVGGGNIGYEKLTAVIKNSPATNIKIVSISFTDEIKEFVAAHSNIVLIEKEFEPSDLDHADLVIAATGLRKVSEQIKKAAMERRILANVADTPDLCDFYLGAIVQKGDLKIAISTNGKSPTLAKRIREYFEESLPENIQELLDNLQEIRNQMKGDFQAKLSALNELTRTVFKARNDNQIL